MTFREKLLPSKQPVFLAVNTWCPNFQKLTTINNSGSFPLITIAVADADCIKMIDENSLQNATEEKANVLYVNQQKFGFFVVVESGETALGPIGYYCIDCYNKVAYRRENGETLLTIGKYPEFKAGNNYIETKGTKIGNFWKLENEERYI